MKPLSFIRLFLVFTALALSIQPSHAYAERSAGASPVMARKPHQFLQRYLDFSEKDLMKMEKGKVVVKLFEKGGVENEVGAFGVVRVDIPKEVLIKQFRDIETFTASDAVKQIGKFSNPPRRGDLQTLTVDEKDIRDLKKCKPGHCKMKIDTAAMKRFQTEVDWSSPDYREHVTTLMRQILFDYVTDYLKRGNAALGEYHDQEQPLRIADVFQEIVQNSPYLAEYVPELLTYIRDFPHGDLPGVESFLYWSKEEVGLKPVINVFHVFMYTREQGEGEEVFIATKQIYASHYFEGFLSFTAFVDEVGGDNPTASYLMYLNRSRFDQLKGALKGVIVTLAKGKVRKGVKKYFREVRERLKADLILE